MLEKQILLMFIGLVAAYSLRIGTNVNERTKRRASQMEMAERCTDDLTFMAQTLDTKDDDRIVALLDDCLTRYCKLRGAAYNRTRNYQEKVDTTKSTSKFLPRYRSELEASKQTESDGLAHLKDHIIEKLDPLESLLNANPEKGAQLRTVIDPLKSVTTKLENDVNSKMDVNKVDNIKTFDGCEGLETQEVVVPETQDSTNLSKKVPEDNANPESTKEEINGGSNSITQSNDQKSNDQNQPTNEDETQKAASLQEKVNENSKFTDIYDYIPPKDIAEAPDYQINNDLNPSPEIVDQEINEEKRPTNEVGSGTEDSTGLSQYISEVNGNREPKTNGTIDGSSPVQTIAQPSSAQPTSAQPTSAQEIRAEPTTAQPTNRPITARQTTPEPTTPKQTWYGRMKEAVGNYFKG